ncbi:Cadherin-86C [Eufriesea mexicana]|uniref:Cadherin-86C n=1 Tax=Eufriesea mexicana TaxID=516756 RepID=A0A310SGH1_9HYME|nr:Cadherin-86C [Eufriesea mexicana]
MPFAGEWCKVWIYFGFVFAWAKGARPRFDTSTDMGLVLVPADAEVDSVIFRLRATDQDADFPLVFEITATITPVVRIDNLPCTLYNKVCQANVILTKRLVPGRLHDFAVRVRDTKGDSNSMQATISVTNATTPRDKIFPHIPSLIMVPEDTKPGKEIDYLLVRANSWSGKPVYIELWQPKELFTIRQRQTPTQTRGVIILTGELDFETQSMYTLTMYATDPYTEPGKDTRNIAGLSVVVIVQDVQDVPPIFTLAPPLTRINNSVQPGDIILRVHAEDGDKGVPREIVYGLVSEGNPFTPFFNISETSGEITLAKPLDELTQITHVGAPVVLTVVAEEIRRSREEPPAQATVVDVGFLLGEPGNSPPYFESDNYIATIDENPDPGTVINFGEPYSTRVKDEDIGKAGVFALKLENNNNTFEVNPTVAERTADFIITVRDNTLIDYELYKVLSFKIVAQEVGPATNLSTSVPVTIFLRDINDNPPIFDEESYEVTLSENVTAESRVIQVHANDKDTGVYGSIRYTGITGEGSEAFIIDPDTGLITVAVGSSLDREVAAKLVLTVEARDEDGNGNKGVVPLIINLLDVNDNAPIFERDVYEFMLNSDLTNFTSPAFIKAIDSDAEPPNNVVRYELVHGNYENKFYLNETSGEIILLSPITKIRRKKQSAYDKYSNKAGTKFVNSQGGTQDNSLIVTNRESKNESLVNDQKRINLGNLTKEMMMEVIKKRRKRDNDNALYTITARAYDLGVPHLSSETKIRIISGIVMEARIMMFVVPGEQPDSTKTAETLAAITGGRVTVLETRPYIQQNHTGGTGVLPAGGKKIGVCGLAKVTLLYCFLKYNKLMLILSATKLKTRYGYARLLLARRYLEDREGLSSPAPLHPHLNQKRRIVIMQTLTEYRFEHAFVRVSKMFQGSVSKTNRFLEFDLCRVSSCPVRKLSRSRFLMVNDAIYKRCPFVARWVCHTWVPSVASVSWNGRKQAWSADPTRRNWQFNKRNVKNCSLPGDVAYISGHPNDLQVNIEAHRLRDGPTYGHSRRSRMNEQERMYMEDVEEQKARGYRTAELDSLQRHEMDRGSDLQHQAYRQRFMEPDMNEETTIREQHFYREGNAEVLRLVTRGQVEDTSHPHQLHHHRPTTLIVDGKDIILQRFIEDQKSRHELSMQDIEAARSMESHQRPKELCQQQQQPEIILIPDRLDLGHRQHIEEIGPTVQRLVIDHGDYDSQKMEKESLRQEKQDSPGAPIAERPPVIAKDQVQPSNAQYGYHDLELARQNALLTRLLLERENRRAGAGAMDSTSYLETQSLPGQVAIATQTDRTAATQTERQVKSRSDNDESDEESRYRKKLKSRKKYGDGDWKRSRTLWMKSPIEEEGSPCFDKRLSILRKKVREVKEGRKVSLEPEVLREISDSLDGNGSSYKGEEDETMRSYRKSTEQTSISYKILNEKETGSQSSEETRKEDHKTNVTESTSSPEIKLQREKHGHGKADEKSPKREKSKVQQKSEGVMKPSFRILEKEFTMLTKKLSKLGDKKFRESTGSDSTSQEKSDSKETKKDLDQRSSKKVDTTSSQKQTSESGQTASKVDQKGKQRKESAIAKTKQKLKYQQTQVMSTGSSEFDDALDKPKKLNVPRHDILKPKQSLGTHSKLKRLSQIDRREAKKQTAESRDEEAEKRKDGSSSQKAETKSEKTGKVIKASKMTALPRKQNVSEETSTSTEDRKEERAACTLRAFDKKSSTWKESDGMQQHEGDRFAKKIIQKFSDDFVEEPRNENVQPKAVNSVGKERDVGRKKEEKPKVVVDKESGKVDTVPLSKNGIAKIQGSLDKPGKSDEHATAKKAMEDSKTPLHVTEQLITDFTVIHKSPAKKEETSKTIPDQEINIPGPSKIESMTMKEPMKYKEESVKNGNGIEATETTQADRLMSGTWKGLAQHVQDKLDSYMEKMKSVGDSEKQIEAKTEVEVQEQSLEDKEAANRDKKRDQVDETIQEKEKEVEHVDTLTPVLIVEDEKKDSTKIAINGYEKKKIDLDTMKIASKEEVISKVETDVAIIEENIFLDEKKDDKGEVKQTKPHDQIEKDILVDEETKIRDEEKDTMKGLTKHFEIGEKVMEEREIVKEKFEDEEIDKEKAMDDKIIGETIVEHKTEESVIKDENIDKEVMEDDKIPKGTIIELKIPEEPTEDQEIDKEIIEDRRIIKETIVDDKIAEETIEETKIDTEMKEDYKIIGETTVDDKMIEKKPEDQKIGGEEVKDHKIAEESGEEIDKETMQDHKIDDEPIMDQTVPEETTDKKKVDKETTQEYETARKPTVEYEDTEEIIKDKKVDEETIKDFKIVAEETTHPKIDISEDTIVIEADDYHKTLTKIDDIIPKEAISDEEKKTLTKIGDDKEESIFLEEGKSSEEGTIATEIKTEDHEISKEKISLDEEVKIAEIIEDDQNRDTQNSEKEAHPEKGEETVEEKSKTEDHSLKEQEDTKSDKIDHQDSKKETDEIQPIDNYEITEKEVQEAQESIEKELVPETSPIEQELTIGSTKDISQIQERLEDKEAFTEIPDVPKAEKVVEEKDDSLKTSPTKEENIEKPEVPTEIPISTSEDIKQDTPKEPPKPDDHVSKKESIFSEVFKVVHNFVDKFTNNKDTSAEETPITKQSHPDTKIDDKEIPSLPSDDKDKKQAEVPSISIPSISQAEMRQEPVGEGYVDVSLPLFTSMIDTVDDSEDSDSSSDISRKTTLTTRPYQTPRHRARQLSEKETSQAKETTEVLDIEDEERGTLTIELIEDDNVESSKEDKIREIEQASSSELAKTEEKQKPESSQETMNIGIVPVPSSHNIENRQEPKKVEREQSSEELSTIAKHTQDTKLDPKKKDQAKTSGAPSNAPSVSKLAKTETFKVADKRTKDLERKRMSIQRKKKSSSEESSEEKAAYMVHRTRKKPLEEQAKQKDSDQAKQSRHKDEESRRKQSLFKSRAEKDKKSSSSGEKYPTPPKTGEIDTSKTQPKYMAWYKKNREEMERKRAELMATDDEEQLPKWLRRSMRSQKSEKEEKKQSSEKPAELTPRTRRKVKPLVNVESEQLKAIVRQGRKLRKAEGGKNEDPPIQIFATTPPSVSQTDSKHHLVQHSEYKYEKIPAPFYLHPPPAPHPSPQLSPEHFDIPSAIEREHTEEDFDPGIPMSVQSGNRLRHQQLLEKKSVFDIAYSEAAPSQLRSDSTTPPS